MGETFFQRELLHKEIFMIIFLQSFYQLTDSERSFNVWSLASSRTIENDESAKGFLEQETKCRLTGTNFLDVVRVSAGAADGIPLTNAPNNRYH